MLTDAAINQWERDVCLKVRSVERAFVLTMIASIWRKSEIKQLKNNYILLLTIVPL